MTMHHTSRRALLKGAAVLTALPVAALGGVPVLDVVDGFATPQPDPYAKRILKAAEWFGVAPPALVYDPDEPDDLLLTEELVAWMKELGRPAMGWILGDTPASYTREQALADREAWLQEQWFVKILAGFDDTEARLILDAIHRSQSGDVSLDEALTACGAQIQAHRTTKERALQ
jgi:hypothetical protein